MADAVDVQLRGGASGFIAAFNDATNAVNNLRKGLMGIRDTAGHYLEQEVGRIKKLTAGITAGIATSAVAGGIATKTFSTFQGAMQNVATVADQSQMSIGRMGDAIRQLAISGEVSQSADDLATGLYDVASSGFQGSDALKVLTASAKAASAGLTDTQTAGAAIAAVLNAYGMAAGQASQVSDILFHTVNVGVLNFEQLANTVTDWAAIAANLHVPIGTATAALAAMTKAGSNANIASTQLRTLMLSFINPSKGMSDALDKIGVTSGEALIQQEGLAGAIDKVVATTNGSASEMQGLFNDVQALNGVMQLTGAQAGFFKDQVKAMSDAQGVAGETSKALKEQQKGLGVQWAQFKNQTAELKREMGELLAPMEEFVLRAGTGFLRFFNNMPEPIRKTGAALQLLSPVAAVVGGAFAIHAIKGLIFAKAMKTIADSIRGVQILMKIPFMNKFVQQIESFRGITDLITRNLVKVIKESKTFKEALLNIASSAATTAAALGIITVTLIKINSAMEDSKRRAQEWIENMKIDPSTINSVNQLNDAIAKVNATYASNPGYKSRSFIPGFGRGVLEGLQFFDPFDRNTLADEDQKGKQIRELQNNLMLLQRAAVFVGRTVDLNKFLPDEQKTKNIENLNAAINAGVIDWQQLSQQVTRYNALVDKASDLAGKGKSLSPAESAELNQLTLAIAGANDKADAWNNKQAEAANVAKMFGTQMVALGKNIRSFALDVIAAAEAQRTFTNVLEQGQKKALDVRNSQASAGDALRNFAQSMHDIKEEMGGIPEDIFNPFTKYGGELQNQLSSIGGAMADFANQVYQQTGSAEEANKALLGMASGFTNVASQAGFSANQISIMLGLMGLTPDTVESLVRVPGASEAISLLSSVVGGLNAVNGYTAVATVMVRIAMGTYELPGTGIVAENNGDLTGLAYATPDSVGAAIAKQQQANATSFADAMKQGQDIAKNVAAGIGDAMKGFKYGGGGGGGGRGGGGGGGGGGGTPKWAPTAEVARRAAEELAKPVIQFMAGDLADAALKQFNSAGMKGYIVNLLASGATRVGAGIITQAAREGTDPTQQFQEVADSYYTLAHKIGEDNAMLVLNYYESADAFKEATDTIIQQIEFRQAKEDWLYKNQQLSTDQYKEILQQRLQYAEAYSSDWMSIMDQLKDVTEQADRDAMTKEENYYETGRISAAEYLASLRARLAGMTEYSDNWMEAWRKIKSLEQDMTQEQRRQTKARLDLGEMSRQAYLDYLRNMLAATEKYSEDYMNIWQEIQNMQQEITQDTQSLAEAMRSFASEISDPIHQATSLFSAFANQLDVTGDQIRGFYEHMEEGTKRWTESIRQLSGSGIDKTFLLDLIKQGPQSLSLAQAILGMGAEGISFINTSLADINKMTGGLVTDVAQMYPAAQTVTDNSVHITLGDVTVDVAAAGLTPADISSAISNALQQAVREITMGTK